MIMMTAPLFAAEPSCPAAQPEYGGILHMGFYGQAGVVNPVSTCNGIPSFVTELVFNRLVRTNPQGKIEGDLAASWEISADGTVYTFFLKKGIRFHDGSELTADDVSATFQAIMNPDNGSPFAANYADVEKTEIVDKYIFRVKLRGARVSFLADIQNGILPHHLYKTNRDLRESNFNWRPIGTGPFRFKERRADGSIVLEANMDYFEGRPRLDGIVFGFFADEEALWRAFMRREIDIYLFVNPRNFEWCSKDPAFKTFEYEDANYYNVSYNFKSSIVSDIVVRKAIAHAIDRFELIQRVERGFGAEADGPFLKSSWAHNPDVQAFEYDPEKSRILLQSAGWTMGSDGFFNKDGKTLVIRLLVDAQNPKFMKIAMILRQRLAEAGIELRIVRSERVFISGRSPEDVDAWLTLDSTGAHVGDAVKTFGSSQTMKNTQWQLPASSGHMDDLIRRATVVSDISERQGIYHELHALIYANQPKCFLYFPHLLHAASRDLAGVQLFLNDNMPTYALKDVYFKSEQKGR